MLTRARLGDAIERTVEGSGVGLDRFNAFWLKLEPESTKQQNHATL